MECFASQLKNYLVIFLAAALSCTGYGQDIVRSPIQEKATSIRLEGYPDWLALDEKFVWVSNEGLETIQKIDVKTLRVVAQIQVHSPCAAPTVGFGSFWTASCKDQTLVRINQESNQVEARVSVMLASTEGSIVAAEGAVWILSDIRGVLTRVDPSTNAVVATIRTKPNSFAAMAGFGSIWITNTGPEGFTGPGTVQRIDPLTNQVVATIEVGPAPRFLAVGEGAVWTLNQEDGSVSRIDPQTNQLVATILCGVPGTGGDIAVGEGSVWVRAKKELLLRVDPRTNRVVEIFGPPAGSGAVRAGNGAVWITAHDVFMLWKLNLK